MRCRAREQTHAVDLSADRGGRRDGGCHGRGGAVPAERADRADRRRPVVGRDGPRRHPVGRDDAEPSSGSRRVHRRRRGGQCRLVRRRADAARRQPEDRRGPVAAAARRDPHHRAGDRRAADPAGAGRGRARELGSRGRWCGPLRSVRQRRAGNIEPAGADPRPGADHRGVAEPYRSWQRRCAGSPRHGFRPALARLRGPRHLRGGLAAGRCAGQRRRACRPAGRVP